jgi:hypothetical protein
MVFASLRVTVAICLSIWAMFANGSGVAVASDVIAPAVRPVGPAAILVQEVQVTPMSEDQFWAIIASTTAYESDPDAQLAALHAALSRLSVEQVLAYEATFDQLMRRSYSWDLWGAAYLINGGASDDGFEYFRCWLISRGREVFERSVADPDSLADIVPMDATDGLDFELFAYVAREVWGEKTGQASNLMPNAAPMMYPDLQPSGVKFETDGSSLARRYPKLWRRFGHG